jgi:mannosyltransferase OCH1-like enzyme
MKYVFVSDYVRFYALYKYAGVYFDTDMFVDKYFSNLLNTKFLIGYEDASEKFISGGIIASVAKHRLIEKIIDTYENLRFDKTDMLDLKVPKIITNAMHELSDRQNLRILPNDYFYPYPFAKREVDRDCRSHATENTFCIHLWDLSWRSPLKNFKIIVKRFIDKTVGELFR